MKQANGSGSVYKLSGNRRKPFVAMVTVKTVYDEEKDNYILKRKALGYFKTQQEARKCLADYNENPCSPDLIDITAQQIWEEIEPRLKDKLSKSRFDGYVSGFNYLEPIKNIRIKDIRTQQLQKIIDDCEKKSATKTNIKAVMSKIYEYAMQNDFVSKDYSQYVKFEKDAVEIKRELFSSKEVQILLDNQGTWEVDLMLVLLFSGMRINEFLASKSHDIDLDNKIITLPRNIVKNDSSARVIPIHETIVPILTRFKNVGSDWIAVKPNKTHIEYKNFMDRDLQKITDLVGTRHTPHDTRHTFITRARECGCNNLVIQRIVGHTPTTITEQIYTHLQIEELLTEINKISFC